MPEPLVIATSDKSGKPIVLLPGLANRHGLISGATGTGKTVTLQVLAERFSSIGVPVFMADVKGDLSGLAAPGKDSPKMEARLAQLKLEKPVWMGCPVTFWDIYWRSRCGWVARLLSGIYTANWDTRSAPPYPTWGRCCLDGYST